RRTPDDRPAATSQRWTGRLRARQAVPSAGTVSFTLRELLMLQNRRYLGRDPSIAGSTCAFRAVPRAHSRTIQSGSLAPYHTYGRVAVSSRESSPLLPSVSTGQDDRSHSGGAWVQ